MPIGNHDAQEAQDLADYILENLPSQHAKEDLKYIRQRAFEGSDFHNYVLRLIRAGMGHCL